MINKSFWKNKKVLITGHTGFKGGWLSMWLNELGAKISGYALDPEGKFNFFNVNNIKKIFEYDFRGDILNFKNFKQSVNICNPEIIFHLAAQSSVIVSYKNPIKTINTNVLGTANLLEIIKNKTNIKSVIIVTTDKVYENKETNKKYNENSRLGGSDVYSGSKAASELIINSYVRSFFLNSTCNIATVRAGNCIGGGDWTKDRIVKDCVDSFFKNKDLIIRKPMATRPWQHVLEPIHGYLSLSEKLFLNKNKSKFVGSWNFGPNYKNNLNVISLAKLIKKKIGSKSRIVIRKNNKFKESTKLSISSIKAFQNIGWFSRISILKTLDMIISWYAAHLRKENMFLFTRKQILEFQKDIVF
jgi:CDP-glucose 4,6-dehydratase